MKQYLKKVIELQRRFKHFSITKIPWASNAQADKLSKLSIDSSAQLGRAVLVEELTTPTVERKTNLRVEVEELEDYWMTPSSSN